MFYIEFTSASRKHTEWLWERLNSLADVKGDIVYSGNGRVLNLRFAKKEVLEIIKKIYYSPSVVCLSRKKNKIKKQLRLRESNRICT